MTRFEKEISSMNRYKYLLKNVGLLTLSSFATKLLSFFLVPLYTNILTATEYGTYDLFNTTIGVLIPILTLNIQEAVMRFSIDSSYNRKSIITISTKYLIKIIYNNYRNWRTIWRTKILNQDLYQCLEELM